MIVELAVVRGLPRSRITVADASIAYRIALMFPGDDLPTEHGSTDAPSIASYIGDPMAPACCIFWWSADTHQYAKLDIRRPMSTLLFLKTQLSSDDLSMWPFLLYLPRGPQSHAIPNVHGQLQSDDVHLLPSSHTGLSPPRLPYRERIAAPPPSLADEDDDDRSMISFNFCSFGDAERDSHEVSSIDGADDDHDDDDDDDEEMLMGLHHGLGVRIEDEEEQEEASGVTVQTFGTETLWRVKLHRADKDVVFVQFLDQFFETTVLSGPLHDAAANIKILVKYIGEDGLGYGLVVEMLSYIWKYLFSTHHFISEGGYSLPAHHPETFLKSGHLGLLAAISLSYNVRPEGLHPMFLRRTDEQPMLQKDAALFSKEKCGFVPEDYAALAADRADLSDYWNTTYHFDTYVMPLARVFSQTLFESHIRPEMYRCITVPNMTALRILDTFRFYFFQYVDAPDNALTERAVAHAIQSSTFGENLSVADLIGYFYLNPEDHDAESKQSMQLFLAVLAEFSKEKVLSLMQCCTNRLYPTSVQVCFRDKVYFSTCLCILQLSRHYTDKKTLSKHLDALLSLDIPSMAYTEQRV